MDLQGIKMGLSIAACFLGGITVLFYLYVKLFTSKTK